MKHRERKYLNTGNRDRGIDWRAGFIVAMVFYLGIGHLHAQGNGFADDFTVDNTLTNIGAWSNSSGEFSFTPGGDGMLLNTSSDGSLPGSLYIHFRDASDSFGISAAHKASEPAQNGGYSTLSIEAYLFSESPDSVLNNGAGNIEAEIHFGRDSANNLAVFYCAIRRTADGEEKYSNNAGEVCGSFDALGLNADTQYPMDVSLDRTASTMTFSFNGQDRVFDIEGPIYTPSYAMKRVQLSVNNGPASPEVVVSEIRLGDRVLDTKGSNADRLLANYYSLWDLYGTQRTASVEDGTLQLTASDADGNQWSNRLGISSPTDYLESTMSLSSDSTLGDAADSGISARLGSALYNTLADGGVNDREGDVRAFLTMDLRTNGLARFEYCLQRYDDPEGDSRTGLLEEGEQCRNFPLRAQLDTVYRTSIALDRQASTVTFRVDDHVATIPVESPFYRAGRSFAELGVSPRNMSNAVLLVDEIRTSSSAITSTEAAQGLADPVPFPEPNNGVIPELDSTIDSPWPDSTTPLDFVDDFSNTAINLALSPDNRGGTYGIAFADGAIELQARHNGNPDNWAGNNIELFQQTDSLGARVSMSSKTRITAENQSEARVRLNGVFWNDTADGGHDGEDGDIWLQLRMQFRGDGSRSASACIARHLADGSDERYNLFDGDDCFTFETIPEYDTQYDMSIELDREQQLIRFRFADEVREFSTGQVFTPSRRYKSVQAIHNRSSSGRTVARIYSITTDQGVQDFSQSLPVFGPYRPIWELKHPGRLASIENGRLRFEVDGSVHEGNRPRLVSENPSDYVSAITSVSSESVVLSEDGIRFGIGGHMYNDIADGGVDDGDENNEGAVYGIAALVFTQSGAFVEYCAWRSNDASFGNSTQLIGEDPEQCARFDTVPEMDTDYTLTMWLDRDRGVLVYQVNDEIKEYTITTGIYTPNNYFNGLRADVNDASKLIAYADDLAYAENPVPLTLSATRVGATGETGGSSGSSGGGGCSVGGSGSTTPFLPMLLFAASLLHLSRRYRRR